MTETQLNPTETVWRNFFDLMTAANIHDAAATCSHETPDRT